MKGPLFWKILIGFVFTITAIWIGVWIAFRMYASPPEMFYVGYLKRVVPEFVDKAMDIGKHDGMEALQKAIQTWPDNIKNHLEIQFVDREASDEANADALSIKALRNAQSGERFISLLRENPAFVGTFETPDGKFVRLKFDVANIIAEIPGHSKWHVPAPLVILGGLGALVFSFVLAWYLTRPILNIGRGFKYLASGNLDFRLADTVGRRRDEIADLARDFDVMAGQLQKLVGARDRLLNDVSHELRSPLARLQLAVALARQNPQKNTTSLARIEKEAVRLDELIGELLTLSRAESGAGHNRVWVELRQLLDRVISDARFEAEARDIRIDTDLQYLSECDKNSSQHNSQATTRQQVLFAAPELLLRAFENIVRNALHYSENGGTVGIRVENDQAASRFIVTISDGGPGISSMQSETLFEPFVRGENTPTSGFGLGLSIAKRAIHAHGGEIIARNRKGERGLDVIIYLPYQNQGSEEQAKLLS